MDIPRYMPESSTLKNSDGVAVVLLFSDIGQCTNFLHRRGLSPNAHRFENRELRRELKRLRRRGARFVAFDYHGGPSANVYDIESVIKAIGVADEFDAEMLG